MVNYVNQDTFINWYNTTSKKSLNPSTLLSNVHQLYCDTHKEVFVIPASDSVTGKDEEYHFKFDDIGCCGASTIYIYF